MSPEKSVEEKIRQAIANGEFDNLAGAGKPLNFDDYFNTPEDVRMGYSVLKSNNLCLKKRIGLKKSANLKRK